MREVLTQNSTCSLRNGVQIPRLGYGTFECPPEQVINGVRWALELGCRHIDGARAYDNESAVGEAIARSGVERKELFLVSKVWMTDYADVRTAFETSARKLRTDYLDLLMLHWPGTDRTLRLKAYETLLTLCQEGKIRAAGVSNFMIDHLQDLKGEFGEYPLSNQIQIHPWGQQEPLRQFCIQNGIAVEAWGPLMHGSLSQAAELLPIAANYRKSPAQVVLRWHLQKGNIIFPKSLHKERIAENMQLFDFSLSEQDMQLIDGLERDWHWGPEPYSFNG